MLFILDPIWGSIFVRERLTVKIGCAALSVWIKLTGAYSYATNVST